MTEDTNSKTRSKLMGCLIAALVPVVLVGMMLIVLIINNRPPNIKVPTHGVPKDNGFDYFVRAGEAIGTTAHCGPLSDPKGPDHWTMADYEAFMKANAPALAIFRQGLSKPCVCPAPRSTAQIGRLFPYFARGRELARTLRSEAMYYEKKGDYGRAVDSQMDCIELGVSLPRGGALIQDLVGVAIVAIGSSKIKDNLAQLNPDELAHAAARIERIQKDIVPYGDALMEESRVSVIMYSEMLTNLSEAGSMMSIVTIPAQISFLSVSSSGSSAKNFVGITKYAFTNKALMVNRGYAYSKKLAAETKKPYTGRWSAPAPNDLFSQDLDDTALTGWQYHLRSQVTICLIETEIALRRYNAANGRYPDKLEQITPKYLKNLPIDPFGNGKPLRYKPIDNGKSFIVYSLGQNLVDDGGRPGLTPGDRETGDVILGEP